MKNKNLYLKIILFLIIGLLLNIYLPWYSFGIGFAVLAFLLEKTKKPFWFGFNLSFILWAGMAAYLVTSRNSLLAIKIAEIFPLNGSPLLLILITGILGGIYGGLWTLTGTYLNSFNK